MFETWYAMSVLVSAGLDISPVITHRFPYTEFEEAFDTAAQRPLRQGHPRLGGLSRWAGPRTALRSELSDRLDADARDRGLQARAGDGVAAGAPMSPTTAGRPILNLCANNYLGLADDPRVVDAAREALDDVGLRHGVGALHLRDADHPPRRSSSGSRSSSAPRTPSCSASCFDANGGVFEALLDERDAVISDALNHASIIDGVRLCKARRLRYANRDMAELEARLVEAADARYRLVVTDGVFSMDGYLAPLDADLRARRHATTRW